MKNLIKPFLYLAVLFLLAQIYACTKQGNSPVVNRSTTSSHKQLFSDSDSTYIAHLKIDSNHTDTVRYFVVYCFLTTAHSSIHLTVPGNFTVSGTLFYGTPAQIAGSVTVYTGHNYGSTSFSTRSGTAFTYTGLSASPSTYGGHPITIRIDPGPF